MSAPATPSPVTEHRGRWKWFLALGALLLVLGIVGSLATILELSSILLFGPLLLASSMVQLLVAFFAQEHKKESLLHFAAAVVEMILGFLIMAYPPERVGQLVALVAILLIVSGLLRLGRSLAKESRGRAWVVMTGVVAMLLGISVWVGGSATRLWLIGLCIAIDFLVHGVSWSAFAFMERGRQQMRSSPDGR